METNNEVNHLRQSLSIYDEKLKPIIKEKGKLYATKFLFDLKLGYSLRELKDYIDYFSAIVLSFEMQERDIKVNEYDKLKEEKEYAEAEGKRLSEVATHWQKECERIKQSLELFRDKYFSKDGNLTGHQYDEITEIIKQVENK